MTTLSNNQIKFIKSLHQKKYRQEHQMFLLEGEKLVNEALRDKPEIIEYIIIKDNYDFKAPASIPIYTLPNKLFESISTLVSPPPIIAVCHFLPQPSLPLINLSKHFTFYLDNINDPGNLGTIIRICDWFGIPQLFCSPNTVELYNPKTINASKGSFLRVQLLYLNFQQLTLTLTSNSPIYAADINGNSIFNLYNKNGLIVLGNEAHGISPTILENVHQKITIPKSPHSRAESLNVATSAAIIAALFSHPIP